MKRSCGLFLVLLLLSVAQAAQIKIAWDPNSESDLAGIRFIRLCFRDYGPPIEVGNVTPIPCQICPWENLLYCRRGLRSNKQRECYSNEVSGIASDSKLLFGMVAFQPMPIPLIFFCLKQAVSYFSCLFDSALSMIIQAEMLISGLVRLKFPLPENISAGTMYLRQG